MSKADYSCCMKCDCKITYVGESESDPAYCEPCYKALAAENAKLKEAIEHIREYWNRDENSGAMSDALWEILDTAEQALKEKP